MTALLGKGLMMDVPSNTDAALHYIILTPRVKLFLCQCIARLLPGKLLHIYSNRTNILNY